VYLSIIISVELFTDTFVPAGVWSKCICREPRHQNQMLQLIQTDRSHLPHLIAHALLKQQLLCSIPEQIKAELQTTHICRLLYASSRVRFCPHSSRGRQIKVRVNAQKIVQIDEEAEPLVIGFKEVQVQVLKLLGLIQNRLELGTLIH